MKYKKRSTILGVFVLGAAILATSAFADAALGSGYYNLKNSVKTTTAKLTEDVDNFSVDLITSVKVDGKVFAETTSNTKFDIKNQAQESSGTDLQKGKIVKNHSYSDENQRIYKNLEDGSYHVVEKQKSNKGKKIIENPFEEEQMKDAEKIMDAFAGSLEDVIQIEESDGKKMYIGNIGDSEIPPLVNTISSFALKYSILDDYTVKRLNIPSPKSNIYVKKASGKAIENEDGILESGIFTASMSAEDSNGTEHVYTLEVSIDIKDINNTVVAAPNLNGQQVTYSKEGFEFDGKFIGKYKNDIVEVDGNSFVKVGERMIEITSVENGTVKGSYNEVYSEGYEPDVVRSFDFTSDPDHTNYNTILNYTDHNGQKKQGVIHRTNLQDIDVVFGVTIDKENGGYSYTNYDDSFNSNFVRVFE